MRVTLIVPISMTIGRTIGRNGDIKYGGRDAIVGTDPGPWPAFDHPISDYHLGGDVGVVTYEIDHREFIVRNPPLMNYGYFPFRIPEEIAYGKVKTRGPDTHTEVNLSR
jgi:hypothetical protein